MSRVLVTGGAGFIGSHLVERLVKEGHEVTVFDDFSSGTNSNLCTVIGRVDVKNVDVSGGVVLDVSRFDMVYHLAADSTIEKDNPASYERNVVGTLLLLEEMKRGEVKKLVFSSSASVYGGTKDTLNPIIFYGASKIACEHLIQVYAAKYGLDYWIYRFGNVVGSRMNHGVIHDFLRQIKERDTIQIRGDGSQVRSFIYIDDLLNALVTSESRPGGLYDLASRDHTNILRVAEIVQEVIARKTNVEHIPKLQGDVDYSSPDSSKLETTGWKARMNSEQAVRRAAEELSKEILA